MPSFVDQLEEFLSPVRDLYMSRYFRRQKKWRKIGYEVEAEPKIRDIDGKVVRDGVLNLPRRSDFGLMTNNGPQYRDLGEICNMMFEPMVIKASSRATIVINPFCWKALTVSFDAEDDTERLKLVRQWYLEAFQTLRLDEGLDVTGTVHALNGPKFKDDRWVIEIDMGSAPISVFASLLDLLVSNGVESVFVGDVVEEHTMVTNRTVSDRTDPG